LKSTPAPTNTANGCDTLLRTLVQTWAGRASFCIFIADFHCGEFFLALWAAWQKDPKRCQRLHVVAIISSLHSAPAARSQDPCATALHHAWPLATPNLHRLIFENSQVQLLLAPGTLTSALPELQFKADIFWLDSAALQASNHWPKHIFKSLARCSAEQAVIYAAGLPGAQILANLRTAGFQSEPLSASPHPQAGENLGHSAHRIAYYRPHYRTPPPAPRSVPAAGAHRHALIIGAGLAGAATALALAEQGWRSTVLDRQKAPAQETSGNPAGLFHGIVNAQDGMHARFNRAAALQAAIAVQHLLNQHPCAGGIQGLLRLENSTASTLAGMQKILHHLQLAPGYVLATTPEQASILAGLPLSQPAWFYPGGGWVRPGALVASYLERAASQCAFLGQQNVHAIRRNATHWQALDAQGKVLAESEVMVLTNAIDAQRLLAHEAWPVHAVRGQISIAQCRANCPSPQRPITGAGYVLPEIDGQLIFGATSQRHDLDPNVRTSDHIHNLAQLSRLLPTPPYRADALQGRTAWRCVADDKLPVIGAVPAVQPHLAGPPCSQARRVARLAGLYIFTALGSRGITWSALGGQIVAACITGTPCPVESSIVDALDPARFRVRNKKNQTAP
jgi:tRNA 5-methylaminomethyl-2-thiouridine biosynthesis bifunctional protein